LVFWEQRTLALTEQETQEVVFAEPEEASWSLRVTSELQQRPAASLACAVEHWVVVWQGLPLMMVLSLGYVPEKLVRWDHLRWLEDLGLHSLPGLVVLVESVGTVLMVQLVAPRELVGLGVTDLGLKQHVPAIQVG
jgi:hypothetical protein